MKYQVTAWTQTAVFAEINALTCEWLIYIYKKTNKFQFRSASVIRSFTQQRVFTCGRGVLVFGGTVELDCVLSLRSSHCAVVLGSSQVDSFDSPSPSLTKSQSGTMSITSVSCRDNSHQETSQKHTTLEKCFHIIRGSRENPQSLEWMSAIGVHFYGSAQLVTVQLKVTVQWHWSSPIRTLDTRLDFCVTVARKTLKTVFLGVLMESSRVLSHLENNISIAESDLKRTQ